MINRLVVQSETSTAKSYRVTLLFGQPVACTCPDFNYRADSASFTCKHMRSAATIADLVVAAVKG